MYIMFVGWLGYPDEKVVWLVSAAIVDGFTYFKIKVGVDYEDDIWCVYMVCELVGLDVFILVDVN